MTGELAILNVGAGDTKISFDPKKPAEVKRAAGIVKDMLKRGFALMIEVGRDDKGPLYRRAHDFDADTAEYIIMDGPDDQLEKPSVKAPKATRGRPRKATATRVPAAKAKAVAVSRTAGG